MDLEDLEGQVALLQELVSLKAMHPEVQDLVNLTDREGLMDQAGLVGLGVRQHHFLYQSVHHLANRTALAD